MGGKATDNQFFEARVPLAYVCFAPTWCLQEKSAETMRPNPVQELADRLSQVLPPGLAAARDELKENFRAILQGQLSDLDLVSREQFEVQKELLGRLRKRVAELEVRLAVLEKQDD
jgi:BMFP domain-containing protein YqiC